jgi:polar amino acid transport system substrate-binding protein
MTTFPKRTLAAFGLAAGLSLTLVGCGTDPIERTGASQSPSPVDATAGPAVETVEAGKLKVCTNPPYAPFEDTDGTEIVGFDMDLTAEVAKDLGLEIEFISIGFETIESAAALDTGSCDIGASALTITEDRAAKLDFSNSYYQTTLGLLVPTDSGVKTLADLEGEPVGVQQGTTGELWAAEQPELTEIRQYEGLGDQITALKTGDVAGVFNDEPTLAPYEEEGFTVLTFETGENFGFAVKKGNTALLEQVNKTLDRVHSDGTYDALIAKWFGV